MSEVCVFLLLFMSKTLCSPSASADDRLPVHVCEVQQADRGQQQVSELWRRPGVAALSAGLAVLPDPPAPHPLPALPWTQQPAAELLQTCHDGEGAACEGDAAHTDREHQGHAAAPEQRQVAAAGRDVELLRRQKPEQREEDVGAAARAQRPQ